MTGAFLRDLADAHPGAPRLNTWAGPLLVLPSRRAEAVPSRLHPLAKEALLACRVFYVDRTCREVSDHFIEKAAKNKHAGGQLRALDRAVWRDLYGVSDSMLSKHHQMDAGDPFGRHQRSKCQQGRVLLNELGAWPWVLFPNGKLPRNWWTLEVPQAALLEWTQLGRARYAITVSWPGLETPC